MEKITLKNTGISVSRLCVGTWSFGGGEGSYWGTQEQSDVDALVGRALDSGINFFDTAIGYNTGASEAALGHALRGRRAEAVVCDKIQPQTWEQLEHYEETITASLRRLETDYIDIMMLHWPCADPKLMAANLEAIKAMHDKGYIRAISISNAGVGSLGLAEQLGIDVALNEFAYNLAARAIEYDVLPYCMDAGIGIAAYMPLMQGLFSGRFTAIADMPPYRRRTIQFNSEGNPVSAHDGKGVEPELMGVVEELVRLAPSTGLTPGQLAIAWTASRPGVATTIVGCRNIAQLDENAAAVNACPPADVLALLDSASDKVKDTMGNECDLWHLGRASRVW